MLSKVQRQNFNDVIHNPYPSVKALDALRDKINLPIPSINKNLKILHISNFGIKNDHRLFNLSIAKKISNGFIRNGHDVINFDYRNHNDGFLKQNSIDNKIISISKNYRPDLILFGHNNSLSRNTLLILKEKLKVKIALWYEDHVVKGDPSYRKNLDLIEKNNDLIDNYFITTAPEIIKTKIKKTKINFLPIPVDPNIESGQFYEINKEKDLFFALSHGVNYGKLKKNTFDERSKFIDKLISISKNKINFNILGLYNEEPKWNYNFLNELMICKTALNLSRGGPSKYCSSNRIATLMGNGVLPFIHKDVKYQDFFDNDEIETYSTINDLTEKLIKIKDQNSLTKRSRNAKKRYFQLFECNIVSDSIINKIFGIKKNFKYYWEF